MERESTLRCAAHVARITLGCHQSENSIASPRYTPLKTASHRVGLWIVFYQQLINLRKLVKNPKLQGVKRLVRTVKKTLLKGAFNAFVILICCFDNLFSKEWVMTGVDLLGSQGSGSQKRSVGKMLGNDAFLRLSPQGCYTTVLVRLIPGTIETRQ